MPFVSKTWFSRSWFSETWFSKIWFAKSGFMKTRFTVCSAIARRALGAAAVLALVSAAASPALSQVRHSIANTAYAVQQINVPDSVGTYAQGVNLYNEVVGYAQIYVERNGANTEITEGFVYRNGRYQSLRPGLADGSTRAFGINDSHEVVGDLLGKDGYRHGFVLADGKYTQYDLALGSASTSIFGVNNGGAFVGTVGSEGFVNIGGTVTEFYGSGTDLTYANAINNSNQVVGQYQDSNSNWHGFSFDVSTGVATPINYPGATQTVAVGINDAGVISGWYQIGEGPNQGQYVSFVEANGIFETVDFFNNTNGINNAGSFVGSYAFGQSGEPIFQTYGYLATPRPIQIVTEISVPNATSTSLYGVNNRGEMVGSYTDTSGNTHGLLIDGSKQTTIDYPGSGAILYDINDYDVIVGAGGPTGAFQYSKGVFTQLDPPGAYGGATATGISDSGLIAGFGHYLGVFLGFYYGDSTYETVGDCYVSSAWGINDIGTVTLPCISGYGPNESSVMDINSGETTAVNAPGASGTVVHSINNLGDLVFTWIGGIGTHSAILKNRTYTYYVFDQPNASVSDPYSGSVGCGQQPPYCSVGAFGINDRDQIVGTYQITAGIDGNPGTTGGFVVQF
jgi:hypothetical protein